MEVVERTHRFSKNRPIECRNWLELTIVEETYRYHVIRYTAKVDNQEEEGLKSLDNQSI